MTTQDPATPTDAPAAVPSDVPADAAAPSTEAARTAIRKARGALARYRVLAIITGVMLLILCVEMLVKYGVGQFVDVEDVMRYVSWIPFAHGWIYVVYLVTVLDLWTKMRWGWGRLATMVFAGVVPVMSFILEKKVHAEAEAKLAVLEEQYAS
jgi:integral membrane protein